MGYQAMSRIQIYMKGIMSVLNIIYVGSRSYLGQQLEFWYIKMGFFSDIKIFSINFPKNWNGYHMAKNQVLMYQCFMVFLMKTFFTNQWFGSE